MPKLESPTPIALQRSGKNPAGQPLLSVLLKLTFAVLPNGAISLADQQLPLQAVADADPETGELLHDTDLYPYKPATDLIVAGHAYPHRTATQFTASITAGATTKNLLVIGDRQAALTPTGQIRFSPPAAITRIPLRFTHAYGGRDSVAEAKYQNPYARFQPYAENLDLRMTSPYLYSRNWAGCGFLIDPTPDALAALRLPNLEDPLNPLTPSTLALGNPDHWPAQPIPQNTSWIHHGWFPRSILSGALKLDPNATGRFAEVDRGYLSPAVPQAPTGPDKFDFRFTNGAPPDLQLTSLRPGDTIELNNLHPTYAQWRFTLPAALPKISTDGRNGKLTLTRPVLHTLLIEPDHSRFSIIYRGTAPALRPYMAHELDKMPFLVEY